MPKDETALDQTFFVLGWVTWMASLSYVNVTLPVSFVLQEVVTRLFICLFT